MTTKKSEAPAPASKKPKKKPSDLVNLTIRLPENEIEQLRDEAKHELISITSLIRRKLFPPSAAA